jgi:CDP-diacylglycerol--serine O-phosphatidyltransferase
MASDRPRHFSMIRGFHLADFFTLANAGCGVGAIFCAMNYAAGGSVVQFHVATVLIVGALVFDVLDGRVARWRQPPACAAAGTGRCWSTSCAAG